MYCSHVRLFGVGFGGLLFIEIPMNGMYLEVSDGIGAFSVSKDGIFPVIYPSGSHAE